MTPFCYNACPPQFMSPQCLLQLWGLTAQEDGNVPSARKVLNAGCRKFPRYASSPFSFQERHARLHSDSPFLVFSRMIMVLSMLACNVYWLPERGYDSLHPSLSVHLSRIHYWHKASITTSPCDLALHLGTSLRPMPMRTAHQNWLCVKLYTCFKNSYQDYDPTMPFQQHHKMTFVNWLTLVWNFTGWLQFLRRETWQINEANSVFAVRMSILTYVIVARSTFLADDRDGTYCHDEATQLDGT